MEEWRPIDNYENYMVSNRGEIKNIKRNRKLTLDISKDNRVSVVLWKNNKSKRIRVHRLVAIAFLPNPLNKPQIDHIDRNSSNNLLENLRWATCRENQINKGISKNNKSGAKGVWWDKRTYKWVAKISLNNKMLYLGSFKNFDDAVEAYKFKSREINGTEFECLN